VVSFHDAAARLETANRDGLDVGAAVLPVDFGLLLLDGVGEASPDAAEVEEFVR